MNPIIIVYIAMQMKQGMNKWWLHWTISLIYHIKVIRISINISCSRNRLNIREEQYGFVQNTGKRNAIVAFKMNQRNAERLNKDTWRASWNIGKVQSL